MSHLLSIDTVASLAIGLGLSAACGFRVFVPLLVLSAAAMTGHAHLSPGFAWVGTVPAAVALSAATLLEVAGYYIPFVDHVLDVVATPAAIAAGILASAAVFLDMPPLLKWSVAIVAGGGVAGLVQGASVMARVKSALFTGGLANPAVATAELGAATGTSVLALVAPVLALAVVAVVIAGMIVITRRIARAALRPSTPRPPRHDGGTRAGHP